MVILVFSNPRHHVEMLIPVGHALRQRGIESRFVSLAELRGLAPPAPESFPGTLERVVPRIRRSPSSGASPGNARPVGSVVRRAVRVLAWHGVLAPRLHGLLRGGDVVVIPNDAAFPYDRIARDLRRSKTPFVLVQEGVRYVTPRERAALDDSYGKGGATSVCVWGEAAADHFRNIGVPERTIAITGNPRFDRIDTSAWQQQGAALRARLGLGHKPLLYLSSAVDDVGLCTTSTKLALFTAFLEAARPVLGRHRRGLIVKIHAREDPQGFLDVIRRCGVPDVHLVEDQPLFAVLSAGCAAVVLSSTVGLEALLFGLPLGVLPIPGHGHLLDYVSSGAALGLAPDRLAEGIEELVAMEEAPQSPHVLHFIERHLAHRGSAAERIAERVLAACR